MCEKSLDQGLTNARNEQRLGIMTTDAEKFQAWLDYVDEPINRPRPILPDPRTMTDQDLRAELRSFDPPKGHSTRRLALEQESARRGTARWVHEDVFGPGFIADLPCAECGQIPCVENLRH